MTLVTSYSQLRGSYHASYRHNMHYKGFKMNYWSLERKYIILTKNKERRGSINHWYMFHYNMLCQMSYICYYVWWTLLPEIQLMGQWHVCRIAVELVMCLEDLTIVMNLLKAIRSPGVSFNVFIKKKDMIASLLRNGKKTLARCSYWTNWQANYIHSYSSAPVVKQIWEICRSNKYG